MGSISNSFFLVLVSEMGNKTKVMDIVLAAEFRKTNPT
jgi:putative Ca2+/H+ antiporter (TMEM165/GDT1 family)